jgi:hypothetical protein
METNNNFLSDTVQEMVTDWMELYNYASKQLMLNKDTIQ